MNPIKKPLQPQSSFFSLNTAVKKSIASFALGALWVPSSPLAYMAADKVIEMLKLPSNISTNSFSGLSPLSEFRNAIVRKVPYDAPRIFKEAAFIGIDYAIFRLGVQDILLTRLPKSLIGRVAPNQASVVESNISKLARIALTASVQTLSSFANTYEPESGWVAIHFVYNATLAATQEVTQSPLATAYMSRLGAVSARSFLNSR